MSGGAASRLWGGLQWANRRAGALIGAKSLPVRLIRKSAGCRLKIVAQIAGRRVILKKCARACSSVDRALDSGSKGRGFKSLHAR